MVLRQLPHCNPWCQEGSKIHVDEWKTVTDKRIHELEAKVKQVEETASSPRPALPTKVSNVEEHMVDVKEAIDIEKRKANLIIRNLTDNHDLKKDTELFAEMLQVMDVTDVSVESISRVGQESDSRVKLVKITMASTTEKFRVLSNARRLNKDGGKFKRVYVCPDLTWNQREIDRKARQELRERRLNGEDNLWIQKGKVVVKKVDVRTTMPASVEADDAAAKKE